MDLLVTLEIRFKREVGENPTRSRHCIAEFSHINHCVIVAWEGEYNNEAKPGDLPIRKHLSYGRIGGCYSDIFLTVLILS